MHACSTAHTRPTRVLSSLAHTGASKEHLAKETCVDPANKELLMCKRVALGKKLPPKEFPRFKHMAKGFGTVKVAGKA